MNTRLHLLFALVGIFVAGCSSPATAVRARGPYVKAGLIVLSEDQAAHHALVTEQKRTTEPTPPSPRPGLDAGSVVVPAGVKVYAVNRAVDAADPEMMHEAHVVYRRETTPQWRLDAPVNQQILVGPQLTDGRQEIQPMLTKEFAAFLAEQRRAAEETQKAIAALFSTVEALRKAQAPAPRRKAVAVPSPATEPRRKAPEAERDRNPDEPDPTAEPDTPERT